MDAIFFQIYYNANTDVYDQEMADLKKIFLSVRRIPRMYAF